MAAPVNDTLDTLVKLVAQLVEERGDTRRLLAAFARGELTNEQVVNELAAQYQTGIGGAVRALAEHDKEAAQQLGARIRSRLDSFMSELAAADGPAARAAHRPANADGFKDRDDAVLLREYVILSALVQSNDSVRSASIFEAVKAVDEEINDETITAHLARLLKAQIIGRQRKGRYHGIAQSQTHLAALMREIEARGLALPRP